MTFKQTATRTVYENQHMVLRQDDFTREDESEGVYTFIEKPDFALIIPMENDGFHMVEQYRYPIARRSLEFPQGTYPNLRDGDPEELARAELAEETGLRAGKIERLGHLYGAPGMTSQGFHVFLAIELTQGDTNREESEADMTQRWVSRSEFTKLVHGDVIFDAPSIAALSLLGSLPKT